MKAKRLPESWEKQTWWQLENGFRICEEWSQCYGPFVKRMESPAGESWDASRGQPPAGPFAFAEAWREGGTGHAARLIRPRFDKQF